MPAIMTARISNNGSRTAILSVQWLELRKDSGTQTVSGFINTFSIENIDQALRFVCSGSRVRFLTTRSKQPILIA
jgi:hypothetical protein